MVSAVGNHTALGGGAGPTRHDLLTAGRTHDV
jgi:hypothetical protein